MAESESRVLEFYEGTSVLITGATGFLGRVLLEKLLRSCATGKIYVLVRSKKEKSLQERCEDVLKVPLFDTVLEQNPNFASKIVFIAGSISSKRLGLSEHDRKRIINDVNVIFHCAATVRFDEHLRLAYESNVQGVEEVVELAQELQNLKALVHVSTFYSNCPRKTIDEEFYEPPMTAEHLKSLLGSLTDEQVSSITQNLIGRWPNTYTFTKCIAEDLLKKRTINMPVAVVRPSIVVSTYKEPVPGWINNYYGVAGMTAVIATGVISTAHVNPDTSADIVPVDCLVNCILVSAYQAYKKKMLNAEATIYNYISIPENKITNRGMEIFNKKHGLQWGSVRCVWHCTYTADKHYWVHRVKVVFRHYLPAYILDFCLNLSGRKAMAVKAYNKLHTFLHALEYFSTREWYGSNQHTKDLWNELGEKDKELFQFSMGSFTWDDYFKTFIKGVRVHLLKDPMKTLRAGRRKMFHLRLIHYAMHMILWFLIFLFLRFIYSMF